MKKSTKKAQILYGSFQTALQIFSSIQKSQCQKAQTTLLLCGSF
jgi:hypothetical protein